LFRRPPCSAGRVKDGKPEALLCHQQQGPRKMAAAGGGGIVGPPSNPLVTPLLTDMYQITMAYSYCKTQASSPAPCMIVFANSCANSVPAPPVTVVAISRTAAARRVQREAR